MFANCRYGSKFSIVLVGLLTLLYFFDFETINLGDINKTSTRHTVNHLSSKCDCRKNEEIFLNRQNPDFYAVTSTLNNSKYNVKETELDELVCGVYETLRRGRHQKVIGYSLYGKENLYTGSLKSKKSQSYGRKASTV
jgi:hypothetical protein